MSFRYPAGLITASSPVNANYPSGVWTLRQALPYLQNNVWGQDPFFDQTVLLLHGDGTNGAQNNTFLDSSSNNFTITRNGNTTQGTFTPFSLAAGEWSNYFDGSGDYLSGASNTALALPGAFTFECWFYPNSFDQVQTIGDTIYSGIAVGSMTIGRTSAATGNLWGIAETGVAWRLTTTTLPTNNAWNHMVVVRDGSNNTALFLNGTRVASGTVTTSFGQNGFTIGSDNNAANSFLDGYLSNVRLVKGTAVYNPTQTTLVVPTTPLTAVTNTSLLTCQSNRFVDNSTNNFAITRNGDVRVTPFSPFQPLLAYSPGVTGGSGYFDGTGDSLSIANAAALDLDANFTIEAWIYPTSLPNTFQTIVITSDNTTGAGGIGIWARSTGEIQVYSIPASSAIIDTSGFGLTVNQWTHIAVTRSGSTVTLYKNGVSFTTGTSSSNFNSSTPTVIGNSTAANQGFFGYISGLRILKGTAQAPDITQPPTNITNTSLLCNFTNAGILDNTAKNVLETVGNAQIDTAVVKYGTGAMEFDGTGDYLKVPDGPDFALGSGNFTIECWVYPNNLTNPYALFGKRNDSTNDIRWVIAYINTNGTIQGLVTTNGSTWAVNAATTSTISASAWSHIAVVRNGSDFSVYVNGTKNTLSSGLSGSVNVDTNPLTIGQMGLTGNFLYSLNGFIDDLRITKGIARYTANFVPPIARFPNQ